MVNPAMTVKSIVEMDIQEAVDKINKLTVILVENNRVDDLIKAATDREYQQKLLKELNID